MKKIFFALIMVIIVGGAAYGVIKYEQPKVDDAKNQQSFLQGQVSELQDKLTAAKAATEPKTDAWNRYCDPQISYCFKFPKDWTFEGGTPDKFKYVAATVTNPGKTVTIRYVSPLVRDGGSSSAHIVKKADLTIGDNQLAIVGSYPVSYGTYRPRWEVLPRKDTADMTAGKVGMYPVNGRFDIGEHKAIILSANGPAFPSAAQAEAWYDAIEGRTVQAILASFSAK